MSLDQTLTIAANATPGSGGQGLNLLHMIEALQPRFRTSLFSQAGHNGLPFLRPPSSRLVRGMIATPYVRGFRGWYTWYGDRHFDQFVAAHLKPATVFQGATGQCLKSLERARQLGAKTALDVVTLHAGLFGAELATECREFGIDSPIHPWLQRRMIAEYESADLIRVMSDVARNTFLERGVRPDKVIVATPPMEYPPEPLATFREPVFRICFVAGIEPWKGFHHLIEAFERLNLPESELELWGWPATRQVRKFVEAAQGRNPRIKVRRELARQVGFAEVYGRASVFAMPSLTDGFGYVVAEAMASGIPVIVTTRTGAADLVTEGENGHVIQPRDVDALCDRLKELATHPGRLPAMGAAARAAIRRLTPEKFAGQWTTAVGQLAE